nr:hypothetical protein [uncultured Flavobacterium sp.]
MGIFDIFKQKPEKNKYQVYYESISEVLNLLERKKRMVENVESGKSIVDLEFDKLMLERMRLVEIIKSGSISFLGNELKNTFLGIFNDEEIKKDEIIHVRNYLINEQHKLEKLF